MIYQGFGAHITYSRAWNGTFDPPPPQKHWSLPTIGRFYPGGSTQNRNRQNAFNLHLLPVAGGGGPGGRAYPLLFFVSCLDRGVATGGYPPGGYLHGGVRPPPKRWVVAGGVDAGAGPSVGSPPGGPVGPVPSGGSGGSVGRRFPSKGAGGIRTGFPGPVPSWRTKGGQGVGNLCSSLYEKHLSLYGIGGAMEMPTWAGRAMEARGLADPSALWDSSLHGDEAYRAALHAVGRYTRKEEKAGREKAAAGIKEGNEARAFFEASDRVELYREIQSLRANDGPKQEEIFRLRDEVARLEGLKALTVPTTPSGPMVPWAAFARALALLEAHGGRVPMDILEARP